MDLFDLIEAEGYVAPVANDSWRPEAPPPLDGIPEIYLNAETDGLMYWEKNRPISISLRAKGRSWYLPWGHRGGGNLSEEVMKEWCRRELRNKHIRNINTRFDIHMLYAWGIDLEAQGNTVEDIGHTVALLDGERYISNLDSLIPDYLHETPMARLDESRMKDYSAGAAAPRSMYNVEAVERLHNVMWPEIIKQELVEVHELENRVIYPVCEMERNGAPIDEELLDKWIIQSNLDLGRLLLKISRDVGFQVNPRSSKDVARVFSKYKLPIDHTITGSDSFTDLILRRHEHPVIQDLRRAKKLMSLRSKYLINTKKHLSSGGILRYALHQLRASKDENDDSGMAGTVTGRFSSAKPMEGVGCNIQQRQKAAKQRVSFGYDEDDESHDNEIFIVRKLHIAKPGYRVLSTDLDQAQYRIFASYVNNPTVIAAYQENRKLKFHNFMHDLVKPHANLSYGQQKDLNFAYIFGAGLMKMALMMKHITQAEYMQIKDSKQWNHPKLEETKKVKAIYERIIPEVKDLLELSMHLAKPQCDEKCKKDDKHHQKRKDQDNYGHRGFVKTMKGRRGRFEDGQRLHKAFNFVDQGTEADYFKTKLVELHNERKNTGFILRIPNHDEIVGDVPDDRCIRMVDEILDIQSFTKLRVPMTWSTEVGPNWAEGKEVDSLHV